MIKIRIHKIKATVYKNRDGHIYGFDISSHAQSAVCAAVSLLALNTVNAIERFTDADFTCEYDEDAKGFLCFRIEDIAAGGYISGADILLKSLELGLKSVKSRYKKNIILKIVTE